MLDTIIDKIADKCDLTPEEKSEFRDTINRNRLVTTIVSWVFITILTGALLAYGKGLGG